MSFHKVWQAARCFFFRFFCMYIQRKRKLLMTVHVICHRELPAFVDLYVFQYLKKIYQLIQSIISWPFSNFRLGDICFMVAFTEEYTFVILGKVSLFFAYVFCLKMFSYNIPKTSLIFFSICDGKILVTCDAVNWSLQWLHL